MAEVMCVNMSNWPAFPLTIASVWAYKLKQGQLASVHYTVQPKPKHTHTHNHTDCQLSSSVGQVTVRGGGMDV